jgi:hypothetical protein
MHAYNPSTQESEARRCEFEASLGYIVISRMAWSTQDPVSKKKKTPYYPTQVMQLVNCKLRTQMQV